TLTLPALAGTDIWSVPSPNPEQHFSAPFACITIPIRSFRRICVTVSADFDTNTQQGGLLFVLPPLHGTNPADAGRRWVTATLEYEHSRMNASVVSCERWSDWSLHALPNDNTKEVTLQMYRKQDPDGSLGSRLVVSMLRDGEWRIIREILWVFEENSGEAWVGVLANQAMDDTGNDTKTVCFTDLVLD
ncbi:hypothetical protein P154DRAFT_403217, partial [Amniculicola lignicola CBS 123094]